MQEIKIPQGNGEINWETGIDIHTLLILCIKYQQITNENLLYSTRTPTQRSEVTKMGRKT